MSKDHNQKSLQRDFNWGTFSFSFKIKHLIYTLGYTLGSLPTYVTLSAPLGEAGIPRTDRGSVGGGGGRPASVIGAETTVELKGSGNAGAGAGAGVATDSSAPWLDAAGKEKHVCSGANCLIDDYPKDAKNANNHVGSTV